MCPFFTLLKKDIPFIMRLEIHRRLPGHYDGESVSEEQIWCWGGVEQIGHGVYKAKYVFEWAILPFRILFIVRNRILLQVNERIWKWKMDVGEKEWEKCSQTFEKWKGVEAKAAKKVNQKPQRRQGTLKYSSAEITSLIETRMDWEKRKTCKQWRRQEDTD